jgi:hypothetical protein
MSDLQQEMEAFFAEYTERWNNQDDAGSAVYFVVTRAAKQAVTTVIAEQTIDAGHANQNIAAVTPANRVGPTHAKDDVPPAKTNDDIVTISTNKISVIPRTGDGCGEAAHDDWATATCAFDITHSKAMKISCLDKVDVCDIGLRPAPEGDGPDQRSTE